jgi:alanine dehydrogenase
VQLDESSIKLTLPNGDKLLADGRVVKDVSINQPAITTVREIQNGRAAARTLEKVHRKLGDLPEGDGKQLNAIAAILMYTGVGLSDEDIAIALGAHVDTIKAIKELDAYKQLSDMFDSNLFDDAKRSATHIIARAAARATDRLVEGIESTNEQVAIVAAREVAKMNGISTEHTGSEKKSGLNIKIVRKGERSVSDETITVELNNG